IKTAPVFLLITFRPEFFPPWLNQPHVTTVHIDRLGRDKAIAMIRDLASGKELPAEVFGAIVSKTYGVPLFIEELTKTVLESGLLRNEGDRPSRHGGRGLLIYFRCLFAVVPPGLGHAACVARFGRGSAEHVPIGEPVRGLVPVWNPIAAAADHSVK